MPSDGCRIKECETEERECEKQRKSKKGCAIQREKGRDKNEETEKRCARSLKDFTSVFSFLPPAVSSSLAADGSLMPDYFPPSSIQKDSPSSARTRKILDSVSLRTEKEEAKNAERATGFSFDSRRNQFLSSRRR